LNSPRPLPQFEFLRRRTPPHHLARVADLSFRRLSVKLFPLIFGCDTRQRASPRTYSVALLRAGNLLFFTRLLVFGLAPEEKFCSRSAYSPTPIIAALSTPPGGLIDSFVLMSFLDRISPISIFFSDGSPLRPFLKTFLSFLPVCYGDLFRSRSFKSSVSLQATPFFFPPAWPRYFPGCSPLDSTPHVLIPLSRHSPIAFPNFSPADPQLL